MRRVLCLLLLLTPGMAMAQEDAWARFSRANVWGQILGTLSNQTDLQTALDAKCTSGGTDGFLARTAANTCTARTITAGAAISVGNGAGTAGNPTIALVEADAEALLDLPDLQGQITDAQIADGAVDGGAGGEIADGSVTADDLGADSVSASELNASGVEAELEAVLDLQDQQGQVTDTQIADGAVDGGTGGEIEDASVTAADLGTDSVSADELNATGVEAELEAVIDIPDLQGQVSDAQIAAGAVDGGNAGEIADGSVTADDLGADSVSSSELDAAGVEAELEAVLDLQDLQGQVADAQIADGAVDGGTGGEIADASITAADLATDSVSADELNATGVEAELEAVIDLPDLQGDLPLSSFAQASAASKLLGRGDSGAGDYQEISLGSGLSMSGTTLSASASSFDPGTMYEMYEEFARGVSASASIGSNGWHITASASGTLSGNIVDSASHPGIVRISSHATNDNSGVNLYPPAGVSSLSTGWFSRDWLMDFLIQPGSNSTAITNVALYVGLASNPTGAIPPATTDGLWIRFDSDRSDATFIFQACYEAANGCAATGDDTYSKVIASSVTPSAGTYYRFRIRRAASGVGGNPTIYMRVNDETEKTFCSSGCDDTAGTVPNDAVIPIISYVTRTTTGVLSADVDYARITMTLTRY